MNISKNSSDFIVKCAGMVGDYEAEMFNIRVGEMDINHFNITSPIEQIFYTAFMAVVKIGRHRDARLYPQFGLGKYRADFLAYGLAAGKRLIIECDSQEFHERTEKERRYEKERDRFFQKSGYRVFRYTGKEIIEKPFTTAGEVIANILDIPATDVVDWNYISGEGE